ncbi:hypothetical protein EMIHUDRAFT_197559 [Emiliania huxleyi CCMP1516]|uniref:Calponin-homology (CH) domain-containing protein n=2 Tax=Emiliania huxleyi TaxID=2903 RepID=A0A0D3IUH4_EMIH1|nr:hypothetical protein EMIHUDRAFT_197559 [Emiliania huxleyi CCMP1516]EOD14909.1 hypothetical protein EMIHUDRAFT_197559 [Emiliania huxleyi CCMP1516]|eukprot:XP_005767338.1 hypothetical protein EMIHUDRAFT_197559 [Emiliania huxleyi CCMP1516]
MSAELLRGWLNDDVGLSRQVGSFEDDLANGYLIGELLHRHAVMTDSAFGGFKDQQAGAAIAKIQNFRQVQQALVDLGVTFDSRLANAEGLFPGIHTMFLR